jgi:hypothetical protein
MALMDLPPVFTCFPNHSNFFFFVLRCSMHYGNSCSPQNTSLSPRRCSSPVNTPELKIYLLRDYLEKLKQMHASLAPIMQMEFRCNLTPGFSPNQSGLPSAFAQNPMNAQNILDPGIKSISICSLDMLTHLLGNPWMADFPGHWNTPRYRWLHKSPV